MLFFEIIDKVEVVQAMRKSGFISDLQEKILHFITIIFTYIIRRIQNIEIY